MAGSSSYEALLQDGVHEDELDHIPVVKPETYYGEGPFDPPSSDDEGDDLLEKSQRSERRRDLEEEGKLVVGQQQRPVSLRLFIIALASLIALAGVIGIFAAFSYTGTPWRRHGTQRITMDHVFNGTFNVQRQSVLWVPEAAGDGVFATSQAGRIDLVDLKTNTTRHLASLTDFRDEDGHFLGAVDWKLSSDLKLMLLKADYLKQWRHSSFGNYYVYDIETKTTFPLTTPSHPPVISYAKWAPVGQSIAYVSENDLYVVERPSADATPIRVTSSGNASLFHGVPDWVYEEEVLSSDYALWWSPDASKIAFLRFDETAVDEYAFPIYNPTNDADAVIPYPDEVVMKYPKPGYNNPLVSVHVFELDQYRDAIEIGYYPSEALSAATLELDWAGRQLANESIIQEVVWIANTTLLAKEINRAGNNGSVALFDLHEGERGRGQLVRRLGKSGEEGDDGWIDASQNVYPIPASVSPDGLPAYLDVIPNEGYNHIALFSPANSSTPQFLTSGKWEVTGGVLAVDLNRSSVYFQAANPSSIQRHIYSVLLPKLNSESSELTALTDPSVPAYYDASFSPQGGFYLLSYRGPQVPWQRLVRMDDGEYDYVLTENARLNDTLRQFDTPVVVRSVIESDGYELNTIELRPPRMDTSGRTKYPVLFRVYGGPGSQTVSHQFGLDWHFFVASTLQYIVVSVDGRGTGFKGRALRNPVKDNLGYWETEDQLNAARVWASKNYVDPERIGIWGWSYGGFMSSKVLEADAGIHSLAMAVAPVTSWRLYDSVYTERYMNLPDVNPDGYVTASISNVTGFAHANYLLAHGSGDDNVHFANSAHLLDMFTKAKIRNFAFRMFTDSDHSISRRGANREVYEFLTGFLMEKWGKGPKRRG